MSILFQEKNRIFTLDTENSTYQMQIASGKHLLHLYYGEKLYCGTAEHSIIEYGMYFCPNYLFDGDITYSPNLLPQEYSCFGTGDFRTACLHTGFADGSQSVDLCYEAHRILDEKPRLNGLPSTYFDDDSSETLEITLKDASTDLRVILLYTVSEKYDAIIRSCRIVNDNKDKIVLESALSCCLDFTDSGYDFISFGGRALAERMINKTGIAQGKMSVESVQGVSSHSENPFVILCSKNTTEEQGSCYGVSLLYSGNFIASAEVDSASNTRVTIGINPTGFRYSVYTGEEFQTPEVVLCYSGKGFGKMSRCLNALYREHLCRGYYKNHRSPVLINSWETFIYDFNSDKLTELAKNAAKCGIEMLVLDDGWFGNRSDDDCSLGDWYANEDKLQGTLAELTNRINAQGLKFGLWFEPEMISEKSFLYKEHPDWCLRCPGRIPASCRNQLVLDMSRQEVVDYLFNTLFNVLNSANIEYIKWDMNRPLTDVYSSALPPENQGEVYHKYVLGTYSLLERLTNAFPKILFEGCSSGGGRFDAGMLYYTPQIWCSDNSDASDRTLIQYCTSFGYPMSAISAHVSPCPNHQTGRSLPLKTRGVVAMTGSFGYELNIGELTPEEALEISLQVDFYKKNYELFGYGDYYRLTNPLCNNIAAWQFSSGDRRKAIAGVCWNRQKANSSPFRVCLNGLNKKKLYDVVIDGERFETPLSGSVLMNVGLLFQYAKTDYKAFFIELNQIV